MSFDDLFILVVLIVIVVAVISFMRRQKSSTGSESTTSSAPSGQMGNTLTLTDYRCENFSDDGGLQGVIHYAGTGTLIVETAFDNGVKSKDDLSVKNVTLKVTAPGNALKGNDSVKIESVSNDMIVPDINSKL